MFFVFIIIIIVVVVVVVLGWGFYFICFVGGGVFIGQWDRGKLIYVSTYI